MPTIKKRIGYLPLPKIQQIIIEIANKEKISQSKVVGILVEEALIARGLVETHKINHLTRKNRYKFENILDNSLSKNNDIDELISDKGITYNTNKYIDTQNEISTESREIYNEEFFDQFKEFILFRKMIQK